mgnify:CR=1 FL=1
MKTIKTYKQFKESLVIDLMMSSVDILESMNIWHDVLLTSINAEEKDIFKELKKIGLPSAMDDDDIDIKINPEKKEDGEDEGENDYL